MKEREKTPLRASHADLDVLYSPATRELEKFSYENDLSFPGEYPFTRGVQPTMYRGRLWTMRQYAGFGTSRETNKRYKYLLEQGQTGLSVAFDLPTQLGYDSSDKQARGEVGRVGVAIDTIADMEVLFDSIPLDRVTVSMTINSTAAVIFAMYMALAKKRKIPFENLGGTLQNDMLKEYIARGTYIFPPEPSLRLSADILEYCTKHLPKWNPISVSGYHMREAGATAAQEVAFTLSNGIAYLDSAVGRGFPVDSVAPRFSFFFGCHNNFLEEVAKFRAARRLWAKIVREKFNPENPKSAMLRFHTQTDGCTLTAQQPENNIVRVTMQALAAVLGGTQSLHTNSYDEAMGLPTEESVRVALRTQQIIAGESGVADTVDPLAGSYAIESLTNKIEKQASEYIKKIRDMGGAASSISFMKKEIEESAYAYQQAVEKGEITVVGVNKYVSKEGKSRRLLKVSPKTETSQVKFLKRIKSKRNDGAVSVSLQSLEKSAGTNENLVPVIIDCVERYATLGEIVSVLRRTFGEYK